MSDRHPYFMARPLVAGLVAFAIIGGPAWGMRFLLVVLPRPIKEQRGGDPDLRRRGRLSHRGGEPDQG